MQAAQWDRITMANLLAFLPAPMAAHCLNDSQVLQAVAQLVAQGQLVIKQQITLELEKRLIADLVAAQDAAIANPKYAPDQPKEGETHCSEGTYYIAKTLGLPVLKSLGTGTATGNYHANDMILNLQKAGSGYKKGTPAEAQAFANVGEVAFLTIYRPGKDKKGNPLHGHIATLRPEGVPGDPTEASTSPLVANVGSTNQVERYKPSKQIEFYVPK
jgi:hypothetical protein